MRFTRLYLKTGGSTTLYVYILSIIIVNNHSIRRNLYNACIKYGFSLPNKFLKFIIMKKSLKLNSVEKSIKY